MRSRKKKKNKRISQKRKRVIKIGTVAMGLCFFLLLLQQSGWDGVHTCREKTCFAMLKSIAPMYAGAKESSGKTVVQSMYSVQTQSESDADTLPAEDAQQTNADEILRENAAAKAKEEAQNTTNQEENEEEKQAATQEQETTKEKTQTNSEITSSSNETKKKKAIAVEKMKDFDYLLQQFYTVDKTTTIKASQLNVEKLMKVDCSIKKSTKPQILIYHTHSQEEYSNSKKKDPSTTVVGVGDVLTKLLTEKYGYQVIHNKGTYDVEDRDHAYSKAAPALEKLLSDNPSIEVIIDLHRDGVGDDTRLVTTQSGKKMAKLMFFNGLSRTTAVGDIDYLYNPYIEENLAFSFQMQLEARQSYNGLTRNIYLKGYRYNMHYRPKSLLVEVGAQTNTIEEAKNAMEPFAAILDAVLRK